MDYDPHVLGNLDFTLEPTCEFGQHGSDAPRAQWWYRTRSSGVVPACPQCATQWNGPNVLGPIRGDA